MATDEQIKLAVKEALHRDERLSSDALGVTVQQHVVTLSGVVDTYAAKHAAELAAYRVHPAKGVVNHIEVHQPGVEEHSDEGIARAATMKLHEDRFLPAEHVSVTVDHGLVTLQGEVDYDFQRADAERDVKYLDGVQGVQNLLTVQPGVEAANLVEEHQAE